MGEGVDGGRLTPWVVEGFAAGSGGVEFALGGCDGVGVACAHSGG